MMTDKNQDEERKKQMKSCKFMRRLNANIKKTNPCKNTHNNSPFIRPLIYSNPGSTHGNVYRCKPKKHTGVNVNIS